MRAKEFLTESTLSKTSSASWLGYLEKLLVIDSIAIGEKGEKESGLVLSPKSKAAIKKLVSRIQLGEDPAKMNNDIVSTELTFTNSKSVYQLKQVFKSPEIKSGAGDVAKKYWNDGEVAETLLGAALFARFKSLKDITEADVISALKSSKSSEMGFTNKGKRKNDPVTMIAINKPGNNQLVIDYITNKADLAKKFPSGVKGLDKSLRACVAYVNQSSKVLEAINEIDNNPDSDVIEVKTDGVSDQKGTKADLQLKIGEKIRLLSLKVNAIKQFGQDSGVTPEVITQFFKRFVPDANIDPKIRSQWPEMTRSSSIAMRKTGTLISTFKTIYALIGNIYNSVGKQLNQKLANPTTAAGVIDDIYNGIIHHAQGAAEGQTLVILNPGNKKDWQELEFGPELATALRSFKLSASVSIAGKGGENNHIIKIYGVPADAKASVAMTTNIDTPQQAKAAATKAASGKVTGKPELLLQLRSYIQEAGPTMRNIVEMGPLLKTITEVQDINKVTSVTPIPHPSKVSKASAAVKAPVKTPPQTTNIDGGVMKSPAAAGQLNRQRPLKASKIAMG